MTAIRIEHAGQHFRDLAPKVQAGARRGVLSAALRGVQVIVTQIIPSRSPQPVDRGLYRAGWKARATAHGAEIVNTEPEAVFIEDGVRGSNVKPSRAMVTALLAWMSRKGIGSSRLVATSTKVRFNKKAGRFVPVQTNVERVGDDAKNMALVWPIIQSMKRRGIFNRPGPGLGVMRELVDKYLDEIVRDEVAREVHEALTR